MAWLLLVIGALTFTILPTFFLWRLNFVTSSHRVKPIRHGRRNPREPTHLLIVLGSGGHTAEMIAMLDRAVMDKDAKLRLEWKDFMHRTWVVSSGDAISAQRAKQFEDKAVALSTQESLMDGKVKRATDWGAGTYDIQIVPRAREIHQPLWTSPLSSLKCLLACWTVLTKDVALHKAGKPDFPDVILCNGPATATIMILTSIILRFLNVQGCFTRGKMRTIYVESWARVKKLSLSGTLLSRFVDRFLVQWPQLQKPGSRAEYMGVLV